MLIYTVNGIEWFFCVLCAFAVRLFFNRKVRKGRREFTQKNNHFVPVYGIYVFGIFRYGIDVLTKKCYNEGIIFVNA